MKKTCWLYTIMALLLLLTACGGNPAATSSTPESSEVQTPASTAPVEEIPSTSEPEEKMIEIEIPSEFPGDHDGERPEITMLAQSYENGNIIEIPQLTWATPEEETSAARSINEKILTFAEGYEEFVNGHPEGYTCEIQATAHAIGMQIVIIMQKSFTPSYGAEPGIAVFSYNWVLEQEEGIETAGETELTQEEIIKQITEQAAAQSSLTVTGCELTAYAWIEYGEFYFYQLTAQNAEGEESFQTWAWLEESLLDEFDEIMSGEDAFALLKQTYPDMPPDLDKVAGDQSLPYIEILYDTQSSDGRAWIYTADTEGIVEEVEYEEYRQWLQESQDVLIVEEQIPGTHSFIFKGIKPGYVSLHFAYTYPDNPEEKPEYTSVCLLEVYDDLTLRLESQNDAEGDGYVSQS